jgi:hypothetical protein
MSSDNNTNSSEVQSQITSLQRQIETLQEEINALRLSQLSITSNGTPEHHIISNGVAERITSNGTTERNVTSNGTSESNTTTDSSSERGSSSSTSSEGSTEVPVPRPGQIYGNCILWRPHYEVDPPREDEEVEVVSERLVISVAAVRLGRVPNASFLFAKTLFLPFFSSGILFLPPGGEKRPKNTRKMQMVFFMANGTVRVTVNLTSFDARKDDTWFVPRGRFS